MKFNISSLLVTLFCTLSNASHGYNDVVFEDVPSHMKVGQQIKVSWSTPRDYKVEALGLWKLEDYTRKHEHNIPHLWATAKGNHTMIWTVPNVRRGLGPYRIDFQARELLPGHNSHLVTNSSVWRTVAHTNTFEVSGGVKLLPKEIAGIVVGSIAGVVLLVGGFVLGARIVRKRKSVAVDLPGPSEGGYSDVRETER